MKNETYVCKKCGCIHFYTKAKGPHMGLYCIKCGAWLKWIPGSSSLKAKQTITDDMSSKSITAKIVDTQSLKDEARRNYEENLDDEVPWL